MASTEKRERERRVFEIEDLIGMLYWVVSELAAHKSFHYYQSCTSASFHTFFKNSVMTTSWRVVNS